MSCELLVWVVQIIKTLFQVLGMRNFMTVERSSHSTTPKLDSKVVLQQQF